VAFWATVVVVVALVGYPLSVGPACWVLSRWGGAPDPVGSKYYAVPIAGKLYRPLTAVIAQFDDGNGESAISEAFRWYSELLAADGWNWGWFSVDEEWQWGGLR